MTTKTAPVSYSYDDASHRYFAGAVQWPGVTTSLKQSGHIVTDFFTMQAAERGTLVHHSALAIDYGHPVHPAPGVEGEVAAYVRFLREVRPVFSHIEEAFYHTGLRFAGRPDRVCSNLRGSPAVVELKSGGPASWHAIQLAGYQLLRPTGCRWVVYLKPNGRYDMRRCDNHTDYAVFKRSVADWWATAA